MKRRLMAITLVTAMVLGLTACGGGSTETKAKETQAPSSGGETTASDGEKMSFEDVTGKVTIYTSMYEDIIDKMTAALKDVFPNADIEFFYGGTGTIQSKVAAEIDSGKIGCDLMMVAEPSYSLELKEQGVLHPYKSVEAENLAFDYDKEGYWYPVRLSNMILAYNPDKYSKDELPQSFKDFAEDANVKGAISMSNPLTSGTAMASIVGLLDLYSEDYFENLSNQGVAVESGSVALTKLETGECKEIMVLEESVLKKREEEGSKLEVIYPTDGTIAVPSTIMIVDEKYSANKNAKACEAIVDYFLSEEGQKQIVAGWMHSVRKDYPEAPYDAVPTKDILANKIDVDWEKCYKQREEIRTMFQEHVTVPEK